MDDYKYCIYRTLRSENESSPALSREGSILAGHKFGNTQQPGILTLDPKVRLHSCAKGVRCSTIDEGKVVWIQPIVCRDAGREIGEVGIDEGGDLTNIPKLELDADSVENLVGLLQE